MNARPTVAVALALAFGTGTGSVAVAQTPTDPDARRAAALATDDASAAVLEQRVRDGGLPDLAERLAQREARIGLVVRTSATRSGGRSRLGGPGLLPAGVRWPRHGRTRRPHSFLAAIDLAEVYAAGGDARLPRTGTLLFFADIDNGEARGLTDTSGNRAGDPARVLFVPAGRPLRRATAPAALAAGDGLVLRRRWVSFHARLTLSNAFDAAGDLGLKDAAAMTYDRLAAATVTEDPQVGQAPHWVGGLATGAQGYAEPPGTVKLLQLQADDELAFDFLDAGVVAFRIPAPALARRQWSAVTAFVDSA